VAAACAERQDFRYLYELGTPHRERIETLAREVYGAASVSYADEALAKLTAIDRDPALRQMGTCMVKTHLSLSHDPDVKGRPHGWRLPIRDCLLFKGAGLVVPVAGAVKLMPGMASNPAYRQVDVDVNSGRVTGLG
jgi:formate--tetrahydrofolate ligase